MQTMVHAYFFDTRNASENIAYDALVKQLKSSGHKIFCTWGGSSSHHSTGQLPQWSHD